MNDAPRLVHARTGAVGLSSLDIGLCGGYLLSVLLVGLFFTFKEQRTRERVRQQRLKQAVAGVPNGHKSNNNDRVLEEYYLGGRRIPWWALAVADVSSYIDISGTMINTAFIYALGIKGMYIEIRGGLCLMLAFQLAFTGKLSRRCPVKTKGEWCGSCLIDYNCGRAAVTDCSVLWATGSSFALATGERPCCFARRSPVHPWSVASSP
jgi:hypothetical protein